MKYLKLFEEEVNNPQVGDYVYCEDNVGFNSNLHKYLETHIGRIVDIELNFTNKNAFEYFIEFDDIDKFDFHDEVCLQYKFLPTELLRNRIKKGQQLSDISNIAKFHRREILHFSPNKNDIEMYINAKIYNL